MPVISLPESIIDKPFLELGGIYKIEVSLTQYEDYFISKLSNYSDKYEYFANIESCTQSDLTFYNIFINKVVRGNLSFKAIKVGIEFIQTNNPSLCK